MGDKGARPGWKQRREQEEILPVQKNTTDSLILILVLWSLHSPARLQAISIIIFFLKNKFINAMEKNQVWKRN